MTDYVDLWRCRFEARNGDGDVADAVLADLLARVGSRHRWMHVEKLQEFDGELGFTKAQGED
jgi:isocitrate dehydrogenase